MSGLATTQFGDAVTVNRVATALRDLSQRQGRHCKREVSGVYIFL